MFSPKTSEEHEPASRTICPVLMAYFNKQCHHHVDIVTSAVVSYDGCRSFPKMAYDQLNQAAQCSYPCVVPSHSVSGRASWLVLTKTMWQRWCFGNSGPSHKETGSFHLLSLVTLTVQRPEAPGKEFSDPTWEITWRGHKRPWNHIRNRKFQLSQPSRRISRFLQPWPSPNCNYWKDPKPDQQKNCQGETS